MFKDKLKRADLLLLLFFVACCAAVVLRVHVEATGYISPDSEYYLEAARSFMAGEKFIIRDLYGLHRGIVDAKVYFAQWPIGYPFLIASVSWVSGLNLFWASKAVNLLFAGLGFCLMRYLNRAYSFVLASVYAAFTVLEMYSYTWSECVFLFGCLLFVVLLYKIYTTSNLLLVYLLLAVAGFLFLNRYIGFFVGGLTLMLAILTRLENRKNLSNHLFTAFLLNVAFVWGYVLSNYQIAGYDTDAQRLTADMESPPEVIWMSLKGLTIELFLIRKYYLQNTIDALTLILMALQLSVFGYILYSLRKQTNAITAAFKGNLLSHLAILTASAYLVVLVFLRTISQFDPPNYRLLSPFTFLMLFAVVNYVVALPDGINGAKRAKYVLFVFFLLSLLMNLPKVYLLSKLS
ncbi:hypothetical protein ACFSRY_09650 [Pontibacter locisalis]|uniref:Glycosyltransferase RgtA/B/C/D-like domain-containing protein n=1 Tax=Pontibacter locisalis TaxID=1719035 RepID=A0ABW5IMW4_9BACT